MILARRLLPLRWVPDPAGEDVIHESETCPAEIAQTLWSCLSGPSRSSKGGKVCECPAFLYFEQRPGFVSGQGLDPQGPAGVPLSTFVFREPFCLVLNELNAPW
jgi:hypothetical protein